MASAKTANFDYNVVNGSLEMVGGVTEELSGQLFELVTNQGEWFLGTDFGYPWIAKDTGGDNVGILGSVLDKEFVSAILAEKLLRSGVVQSIESIQLSEDSGQLTGEIREKLIIDSDFLSQDTRTEVLKFSFGGDQ